MLTKDGAKLLDFGLVKRLGASIPSDETQTNTLTSQGTISGTLPYMAPEQLEGKEADNRTDIFAFGAVLFEMLSRRKAFIGNSQANLIAAIMHADPPSLTDVSPRIPQSLDRIVRTCLAKDPENRWQSAQDIALELRFITETPSLVPRRPKPWLTTIGPWLACVLVGGIVALVMWSWLRGSHPDAAVAQFEITAPDKSAFSSFGSAISPDGRYVAFVAITEGKDRLWLRPLNSRNARALEDTEEAQFPFWAPDSSSIAFFTRNKLKRFDLNGVGLRTIATATNGSGGTWNRNGMIVYAPKLNSPLSKVPASGGEPAPATILTRGDVGHNFPQFLPDGRHFLFYARSTDPQRSGPHVGSLDNPTSIEDILELPRNAFQAVYVPLTSSSRGHLIYVRDRSLVAQAFDATKLLLEGEAQPILSRESFNAATFPGFLNLTASAAGILLDGGAQHARNQMVWRKRDGTLIEVAAEESDYITPRISPDESRIAVTKADPISGNYDLWIDDLKHKRLSRLTFQKGLNYYPLWTPDGQSIIYTSNSAGMPGLFRKPAAGNGQSEQLLKSREWGDYGYDISRDGKLLLFIEISDTDRGDIWILPLDQSAAPFAYLKTSAGELHAQFSPPAQPGKWIVYTSDESGIDQVYVRQFTGGAAPQAKWQISLNGGRYPRWRGDGSDVVYLAPDGKLMSVPIRCTRDSVESGTPRPLFDAALPSVPFSRYAYDLSPDGQKFLVLNAAPGRLEVILNWTGLLKP